MRTLITLGRFTRWVQREGNVIEFGNIVRPYIDHTYRFSFPTEELAMEFELLANPTNENGFLTVIPEKWQKYRIDK